MFCASDLRKGLKVEIDGVPYIITDFNFNKPGKGQAIYNCRLKSLINGSTMSRSYRSNDRVDKPALEQKKLQYSYADGTSYVFMDENFEQVMISADVLGENRYFLVENVDVDVLFHNAVPIEITLPTFVERAVIKTEPGARGNTATNVMKPGTIEGGYELQIPLFINEGDIIKIDTRTGKYADRVSKA